jgi:uncharacterized protein (DUF2235 family)
MGRNIVLCCDGTANEFAKDNTNVVKLYSVLTQDPATQVTYYHPGLGTMEPAGALTTFARKLTKVLGMAVGYGLANDMRDAYVFLMRTYRPGDRVFLFGFSRGAYTVRAVASLLHMYGLIRPDNEPLVPYAIRMLMAIKRSQDHDEAAVGAYFKLAAEFKKSMSWTECAPHFVGVWDTVSSVGWLENPLKLPYVANNPSIQVGRHAVAIDERRAFFRTHLWRRPADPKAAYGPRDVQQVWFPGVHCDVGGGYAETGLSDVALRWMVGEAEAAGLLLDPARVDAVLAPAIDARGAAAAPMHESLKGAWHLAEVVLKKRYDMATGRTGRRMNLWRRRSWPAAPLVHVSAFDRGEEYRKRLPPDAVLVGGSGGALGRQSRSA